MTRVQRKIDALLAAGWTARSIALALSVTDRTIYHWSSGRVTPRPRVARRLLALDLLGVAAPTSSISTSAAPVPRDRGTTKRKAAR